jgi:hypothetical protein
MARQRREVADDPGHAAQAVKVCSRSAICPEKSGALWLTPVIVGEPFGVEF